MKRSDPGLLILHEVRLAGFIDAATVADRLDLPRRDVERHLADAGDDGLVRHRSGARSGWYLTDEGRKENERLLAEELDRGGHRDELVEAHQRFLPLNQAMLAACTAWQVIDSSTGTLNDHSDPAHDRAVFEQLVAIDRQIEPICAKLGARLSRFGRYRPRFERARDLVEAGETDWFTRPTIDSYHTVWFELHEDLLATLGLDRTDEAAATGRTVPAAQATTAHAATAEEVGAGPAESIAAGRQRSKED